MNYTQYYNITESGECQALPMKIKNHIEHKNKSLHRNIALSSAYLKLYQETKAPYYKNLAERTSTCATYITFKGYENGHAELIGVNRCKNRYCSYCNWIESKKKGKILSGALQLVKCDGIKISHLVITIPNCKAEQLNKRITVLHRIIAAAMRHFKCKNYYRATEITYNKKENTYHPHAHIGALKYIPVKELSQFCGALYKQFDNEYKYDYTIAYATGKSLETELSKYITKPDKLSEDNMYDLIKYNALHNVRSHSACGSIRDYIKRAEEILNVTEKAKKLEYKDYKPTKATLYFNGETWQRIF